MTNYERLVKAVHMTNEQLVRQKEEEERKRKAEEERRKAEERAKTEMGRQRLLQDKHLTTPAEKTQQPTPTPTQRTSPVQYKDVAYRQPVTPATDALKGFTPVARETALSRLKAPESVRIAHINVDSDSETIPKLQKQLEQWETALADNKNKSSTDKRQRDIIVSNIGKIKSAIHDKERHNTITELEKDVDLKAKYDIGDIQIKMFGKNNDMKRLVKYLTDSSYQQQRNLMLTSGDMVFTNAQHLNDKEKQTILHYASQGDYDSVKRYYDSITPDINKRRQEQTTERISTFAKEHPIISTTILNPTLSMASAVNTPFMYGNKIINKIHESQTGEYVPYDVNKPHTLSAHAQQALRTEVINQAADIGSKIGGQTGAEVSKLITGAVMSFVDNTVQRLIFGKGSLAIVGLSAGGSALVNTVQRGGSDFQAFAMGTATGIIEALTELLPLEFFTQAMKAGASSASELFVNVLKGSLSEFGEEFVNSLADSFFDVRIMGTDSEYNQYKKDLLDSGMSDKDATKKAVTEIYIKQAALSGLSGAISGGLSGGTATLFGIFNNNRQRQQHFNDIGKVTRETGTVETVINNALNLDVDSQGYKLATDINANMAKGNTISDYQIGQLANYVMLNDNITRVNNTTPIVIKQVETELAKGNKRGAIDIAHGAVALYEGEITFIKQTDYLTGKEKTDNIKAITDNINQMKTIANDVRNNNYQADTTTTADTGTLALTPAVIDTPTTVTPITDTATPSQAIETPLAIETPAQEQTVKETPVNEPNSESTEAPAETFTETPVNDVSADDISVDDTIINHVDNVKKSLKRFGVNDVVIETGLGNQRGYYDSESNTIHISADLTTQQAIDSAIAHEVFHVAENIDNTLVDDVIEYMTQSGDYDMSAVRKDFYDAYVKAGVYNFEGKSQAEIDHMMNQEIAAEQLADILEDEGLTERLKEESPSLFRRIIDMIKRLFAKLTGREYKGTENDLPNVVRNIVMDGNNEQQSAQQTTSEQTQTADIDTNKLQYSVSETNKLLKKNKALQKRVDELKYQMTLSKQRNTDRKQTNRYVKELIKSNSVVTDEVVNADVLTEDLLDVYNYLANGEKDGTVDILGAENRLKVIAREIVERAWYKDDPFLEDRKEIRAILRHTPVFLSEEDRGDALEKVGGYESFRKQVLGKIRLVNRKQGAMSVDSLFHELSESYPYYFDGELTHPAEMVMQMAEVFDALAPREVSVFGGYEDEATEIIARDLFDQYFDIPQEYTKADKWQQKVDAEKYKRRTQVAEEKQKRKDSVADEKQKRIDAVAVERQRRINAVAVERQKRIDAVAKKVAELKKRHQAAIDKLKQKQDDKISKMKSDDKRRVYNANTMQIIKRLRTTIAKPTDAKHVVTSLNKPLDAMTKTVESFQTGIDKNGKPTFASVFNESLIIDVVDGLNDAELNDSMVVVEQELYDDLQALRRIKSKYDPQVLKKTANTGGMLRMTQLTAEDAKLLNNVVKALSKLNSNYQYMLGDNQRRLIKDMAEKVIAENTVEAKREKPAQNRLTRFIDNTLNYDVLNTWTFFDKMGESLNEIFLNIVEGEYKHINHVKEIVSFMQNLLKDTDVEEWSGKNAKLIKAEISSGNVSMTTGQLMTLYLINRQADGRRHLLSEQDGKGMVLDKRGKLRAETMNNTLKESDINILLSHLTPTQKHIAEKMGDFLSIDVAKWGNEVSEKQLGYKKFTTENYFPLRVAREFISDGVIAWQSTPRASTLKNAGITKSRTEGATQPLIIGDVFEVFYNHAQTMSAYNAYVLPLDDLNRVMRYQGDKAGVKAIIKTKFGERALKYINDFVNDVNSAEISRNQARADDGIPAMLIRTYKASAVGLNLSVVAKQPMAIFRAGAMIPYKYLLAGSVTGDMKANMAEMHKHSAIAQIKSWGYSDTGYGKSIEALVNKKAETKFQQAGRALLQMANTADDVTWRAIWNAVKAETNKNYPNVKKGSEEYFDIVNKRFREIIGKTQVVDSIFDTPAIMKDRSQYIRMVTAFQGEPLKDYNMLYGVARRLMEEDTPFNRKAMVVASIASILSSIAVSIVDSLRDMWRSPEDEENIQTAAVNILKEMPLNVLTDKLEIVPYVRDMVSLFEGYDVERMDMAAIASLLKSSKRLVKHVTSDEPTLTTLGIIENMTAAVGQLVGIPARTVMRDLKASVRLAMQWTDSEYGEYAMVKLFKNIGSSTNNKEFYDILTKAYLKGDYDTYNNIKNDMLDNGYTVSQIKGALSKAMTNDFDKMYKLWEDGAVNEYDNLFKEYQKSDDWTDEDIYKEMEKRQQAQYKKLYNLFNTNKKAFDKMKDMLIDNGHKENIINESLAKMFDDKIKGQYKELYNIKINTKGKDAQSLYDKKVKEVAKAFGVSEEFIVKGVSEYAKKQK